MRVADCCYNERSHVSDRRKHFSLVSCEHGIVEKCMPIWGISDSHGDHKLIFSRYRVKDLDDHGIQCHWSSPNLRAAKTTF